MKTCPNLVASTILFGLLAASSLTQAQEQVALSDMEVELQMQKTPEFQASVSDSKKDGDRSEWLEIETAFKTRSTSRIKYTEEITFTYYIALEALDATTGEKKATLLTDEITYVNIPDEEDNFAVIYVSPHTLSKLAGGPGDFKESQVLKYGVEASFRSQSLGKVDGDGVIGERDTPWWSSPNLTRVEGQILIKEETPFNLLWIDRHVEAKKD